MCVGPVAKCPPARVAIQPPSVERSNDCGKKRSVIPCSASCSSSRGPVAPAWIRAARDTGSTSSTRSSRPRSSDIPPATRVDAADDARPAAVRRDREVLGVRALERAQHARLVVGPHDDVGQVRELAAQRAHDVEVGAPVRVQARDRGRRVSGAGGSSVGATPKPRCAASPAAPSPTGSSS